MKTDYLTNSDIRNLALQRTGSLFRIPFPKPFSPSYLAWYKLGVNAFLNLEAKIRREAIIRFSIEEIRGEFDRIAKAITTKSPIRIMDIGCGLGIVDILFAESFDIEKILLVDIEENGRKHHGFSDQGAAYNSLEKAMRLVRDNVPQKVDVKTVNPNEEIITKNSFGCYNLIVSFISCGFHYPASTYLNVFSTMLDTGGRIILDLRLGEDHDELLSLFEIESQIEQTAVYRRVVLRRIGN